MRERFCTLEQRPSIAEGVRQAIRGLRFHVGCQHHVCWCQCRCCGQIKAETENVRGSIMSAEGIACYAVEG